MISHVNALLSETRRHPKMAKSDDYGVLTKILHLAPAKRSGYEVCPMRSAGCTASCLNTAGYRHHRKENARINRTKLFFENRTEFMYMLGAEIRTARGSAKRNGKRCGIRLNGTSDIPWEKIPYQDQPNIMAAFPDVCFYDYTKRPNRKILPKNYRLIFSKSEDNFLQVMTAIRNGMNIAVVFNVHKHAALPARWSVGHHDLRVIDGDDHDFRYADYDEFPDERVIVGLRAKGEARHDKTGFVVHPGGREWSL